MVRRAGDRQRLRLGARIVATIALFVLAIPPGSGLHTLGTSAPHAVPRVVGEERLGPPHEGLPSSWAAPHWGFGRDAAAPSDPASGVRPAAVAPDPYNGTWVNAGERAGHLPWPNEVLADDVADGYVVQFAGFVTGAIQTGTWTYRDGHWTNLSLSTGPSIRILPAFAYDSTLRAIVLFGGLTDCSSAGCASQSNDTWIFSGGSWARLPTPTAPSARGGATLVDDPADGGLLLFGGGTVSGSFDSDTWKFANDTWSPLHPTASPSARVLAGLADDVADGQIVLFGGSTVSGSSLVNLNDTWVYNGSTWAAVTTATAPPRGPYFDAMAYDPALGKAVVVTRTSAAFVSNVTWEFSAGNWTTVTSPAVLPPAGAQNIGMDAEDGYLLDTPVPSSTNPSPDYGLAGGNWSVVGHGDVLPSARDFAMMAQDPDNSSVVLYGGYSSGVDHPGTWVFDGLTWQTLTVNSPIARDGGGFAYDAADGYDVLFGGIHSSGVLNDTWTFAHSAWTGLAPTVAPPALYGPCLVYDRALQQVVLFGGFDAAGDPTNETWTFSAGNWTNQTGAPAPPPRGQAACAYDDATASVIVFGGGTRFTTATGSTYPRADTWSYHDGVWSNVTGTSPGPSARDNSVFGAIGPNDTGGLILQGGGNAAISGETYYDDTWLWSGAAWTQLAPAGAGPYVVGAAGAFVPATNSFEAFGGFLATPTGDFAGNETFAFDAPELELSNESHPGPNSLNVTFAATVAGEGTPDSIGWQFGDGSNATGASVVHHYATPGNYSVVATMVDLWGLVTTQQSRVTVYPATEPLSALASVTPLFGTAPLTVTVAVAVHGGLAPYGVRWSFGDGFSATLANTTHTYETAGNYTAGLTVTDAIDENTSATFVVEVNTSTAPPPPLTISASVSPASGIAPLTLSFSVTPGGGAPPYSINWSFGDGQTSTLSSGSTTYATAGVYLVNLTVRDSAQQVENETWGVSVASPNSTAPQPATSPAPISFLEWVALAVVAAVVVGALAFLLVRRGRRPPPAPNVVPRERTP